MCNTAKTKLLKASNHLIHNKDTFWEHVRVSSKTQSIFLIEKANVQLIPSQDDDNKSLNSDFKE